MGVVIRETDDLDAVRELGARSGIEDSGREDEHIRAAWGAFDGDKLVGAIVLERLGDLDTPNWLAVDADYRRCGIAGRLYAALECEALARGVTRLWVTARAPAFFLVRGYDTVADGEEQAILLGECPRCAQFGRGCEPRALTKWIDDTGPPDGPPSEGDT